MFSNMEVFVTSTETIKPSRPTPTHLRRLNLSLLDQVIERHWVPFLYFYSSSDSGPNSIHITTQRLKKSLPETLTKFYPAAGRLKGNLYIECNDEGVEYSEARVNCQLIQVIGNPNKNYAELSKLWPYNSIQDAGDLILLIQVNIFACGGIAIGLCFSHKFLDALSFSQFVNYWAAFSRGDHNSRQGMSLQFGTSMLFPPKPDTVLTAKGMTTVEDKFVAKTFVFGSSAISSLKANYAAAIRRHQGEVQPSRVEALSTFMFSRFVDTLEGDGNSVKGRYIVAQGVNLRQKENPPLPDTYIGNLSWIAAMMFSMDKRTPEEQGYAFVTQMRDAIRKVNINSVKKIQEDKISKEQADMKTQMPGYVQAGGVEGPFTFSSLTRVPLYEADFGWGKPLWVTLGTHPSANIVVLMPSKSGVDIEASITLKEHHMAKLEADKEFRAFASPYTSHLGFSHM